MKEIIPAIKPDSIGKATPGLISISLKMLSPGGRDAYLVRYNSLPIKNNRNIAIINPNDHLPNLVFGRKVIFIILKNPENNKIE